MALGAFEREQVPFGLFRIIPLYADQPHCLAAFGARRGERLIGGECAVHLGLSQQRDYRSHELRAAILGPFATISDRCPRQGRRLLARAVGSLD